MAQQIVEQTRVAVPFVDLGPAHETVRERVLDGIAELLDSGAFTNGPQVEAFEQAFANFCGSRSCVGLASGTDALKFALLAAGIEAGDEVIVPGMTFVATLEAVAQAGGRPVVADVCATDYTIDPVAVEAALTRRTRFLLPVHLYGQMADMRALKHLAAAHDITILEDACQAHGARRDGLGAGTVGVAGAFSFYPSKNLGALGDAGALVTDDGSLAGRVRVLRDHGQERKNEHGLIGYTGRLDTIQAIALIAKLPELVRWNAERRAAAAYYSRALDGVGDLTLPAVPPGSEPVWHVYCVRTEKAEGLSEYLAERNIASGRHYPQCPHLTPAFAWLGYREGEFPIAESLATGSLSLPMYAGITEPQLDAVVRAIGDFFADG